MSRILFAWEMGANYGHLVVSLRVAQKLRERHHSVAFAVRDTRAAAELLSPAGFSFVQAPMFARKPRLSRPPANFSEILLGEGYADKLGLLGAVQAWQSLIRLSHPDVILADYAPTAMIAAHALGKPCLALTNGFGVPPSASPLPSIRPWDDIPTARLIQADNAVNTSIAEVMEAVGAKKRSTVVDLYRHAVLCVFPELDPFGPREGGAYIGPIFALPGAKAAEWPARTARRILAYLRPDIAGFPALMASLSAIDADTLCVIPGLGREQVRRLSTDRLRISTSPLALDGLLREADVFVNYGGSGVLCQALLAGVPALIVPCFVEQNLNALRAGSIGAAITIGTNRSQADFDVALQTILEDTRYGSKARSFADAHAGYDPDQAIAHAVQAIEGLIDPDRSAGEVVND